SNIKDIFSQENETQTIGNRMMNPIQSKSRIDALNARMNNAVMAADVNKKLNPETFEKQIQPFHITLADNKEERPKKMQDVLSLVRSVAAPTPMMSQWAPGSLPKYQV